MLPSRKNELDKEITALKREIEKLKAEKAAEKAARNATAAAASEASTVPVTALRRPRLPSDQHNTSSVLTVGPTIAVHDKRKRENPNSASQEQNAIKATRTFVTGSTLIPENSSISLYLKAKRNAIAKKTQSNTVKKAEQNAENVKQAVAKGVSLNKFRSDRNKQKNYNNTQKAIALGKNIGVKLNLKNWRKIMSDIDNHYVINMYNGIVSNAIIDQVSTLEGLNQWIIDITRINPEGPEIMNIAGGVLSDIFKRIPQQYTKSGIPEALLTKPGLNFDSWNLDVLREFNVISNTGGGKSDCLLISFLMGVSPAYRRLDYDTKYDIAYIFRREILKPMLYRNNQGFRARVNSEKYSLSPNTITRVLEGSQLLSDEIVPFLVYQYEINILQLETAKNDGGFQPPTVTIAEGFRGPYTRGIVILNLSNAHFELVRKNDNQYTFSVDELYTVRNTIIDNSPYVNSTRIFNVGEVVRIKGDPQLYVVKSFVQVQGNVTTYTIENISTGRNSTIPVGTLESGIFHGGRKTQRKTRKSRR